jgi:hypothetical protein
MKYGKLERDNVLTFCYGWRYVMNVGYCTLLIDLYWT